MSHFHETAPIKVAVAAVAVAGANPAERRASGTHFNPVPQNAPGAGAAVGHTIENSIPLSIFPISTDKVCICFCGLPGRGKTHIARRLGRYLSFFHAIPVGIFNVSEYRRKLGGAIRDAEWFDPNHSEGAEFRKKCNQMALDEMTLFLNDHPNGIAILDSTNPSHHRRQRLKASMNAIGVKVLFIEVECEDEDILAQHYKKMSANSPEYHGVSAEEAEADYHKRIEKYREFYEPVDSGDNHSIERKWSYFKCDHSSQHFALNHVQGYIQLKIVNFIINLRTTSHAFYLSRHGQSEYNAIGRIGGDSGLSAHGLNYAHKLAEFVEGKITRGPDGQEVPARLWTSTMRRTRETAQFISQEKLTIKDPDDPTLEYEWMQMRPRRWHHLDELFAGQFDGMTYEEIEEQYPEEFARRTTDKLAYRYPRGESYLDVIARLEPIVIEMERHREPLLIVGHQGILRIIYAFYMGLSRNEAPHVSIPLNCVIELNPSAFDCKVQRHVLHVPLEELPSDGQDEPTQEKNRKHAHNMDPQSH